MKRSFPRLLIGIGVTFFVLTSGCLFGPSLILKTFPKSLSDQKLSAIKKVSLRKDALNIMSDAWHHGVCANGKQNGDIDDIFLFGSKEPNRMDILVVTSEFTYGTYRIVNVTSAERYLLKEYGFDKCLPAWLLATGQTIIPTLSSH